jgi:spore photoproduct lyase
LAVKLEKSRFFQLVPTTEKVRHGQSFSRMMGPGNCAEMSETRNPWDPSRHVKHVYVEECCLEEGICRDILARLACGWSVVPERQKPNGLDEDFVSGLAQGKRQLFLCRNRGQFFKPCPATRAYRCCGYHVINTGVNCPIDCVYCILQAYLNTPWLTFHVNIGQLFDELDKALAAEPERLFRIGTGEFTDSLALDRITGFSPHLVSYFAKQHNAVLELKTKSGVVDNLRGLEHKGNTVVAWSLNSSVIMARDEIRAASLTERLEAARRCAEWGYKLAFHFDPIVLYPGWQEGYEETIVRLFREVPASAIAWISLGALRYLPKLKEIALCRFPDTDIYCQESVVGLDGKLRYFRNSRTELYRYLVERLTPRADSSTCIYFCMESDEIWREVMGFTPQERGGLSRMLDEAARVGRQR